jgi:hypothetical protein
MDLAAALAQLVPALVRANIAHALIGGVALAAHGVHRATADLDFLVDGERADDLHALMARLDYRAIHRTENVASYVSEAPAPGRIDFLFAVRPYAREMLSRARPVPVLSDAAIPVADAADLIGLKVQSSSNDPSRVRLDLSDVERLLRAAPDLDLERVRGYFRLFGRERELDDLLSGLRGR